MLFIHPMWDHESQRIGMQKCTPAGYTLHVLADYIGFFGLLLVFATPALLVWQWLFAAIDWSPLWLLAVAFGFGIVSEVLHQYSWWLALRKGYSYDHQCCEASWLDAGERRTYKYPDRVAEKASEP